MTLIFAELGSKLLGRWAGFASEPRRAPLASSQSSKEREHVTISWPLGVLAMIVTSLIVPGNP